MALYDWSKYNFGYYLNGALCGGICCSVTHGALCPVDVVKTRIQLDPVTYNRGLIGGFRQGWFKFGGNEIFKIKFCKMLGDQKAWDMRTPVMLGASACAEFIADIFLCPLEAARIRQVSDPTFPKGTITAVTKLVKMEGLAGWYSGFVPILFKQIPYTMAKFAVQGAAAESIYGKLPDRKTLGTGTKMGVSLL